MLRDETKEILCKATFEAAGFYYNFIQQNVIVKTEKEFLNVYFVTVR